MEVLEASYKVVTPMFMSGAEQAKAELRLPSIKGALRFWWRALAWGRLQGDLVKIRQEEAILFGSTDTGQAGVLMRLKAMPDVSVSSQKAADWGIKDWQSYVGYGLVDKKSRLERKFINQDLTFTLQLVAEDKQLLHNLTPALKALGLLGGLGGRSRKGWGSSNLQSLSGSCTWLAPNSKERYEYELKALKSSSKDFPDYTAFWNDVSITFGKTQRTGEAAHQYLARIYKKVVCDGNNKSEREQFGLPRSNNNQRRASPVLLHIQQLSTNEYLPVSAFFPAQFLKDQQDPKGKQNKINIFMKAVSNGGLE